MKKLLYLLPVAAMAMASCTNNDDDAIVQGAQQQLATADQLMIFPSIQGASTRTTSFTTNTLRNFYLEAGGKFYFGTDDTDASKPKTPLEEKETITGEISKDGASWTFPDSDSDTKADTYWWADATTKGTFKAFAPADKRSPNSEYTVDNDRTKQVDYLVAYNEGIKNDFRGGVPMNFQHVTSQVKFRALMKSNKVTVKVKAIRMVNLHANGALALPEEKTNKENFWATTAYNPWTLGSVTDTYKVNNGTDVVTLTNVLPTDVTFGDSEFLLPQALAKAELTNDERATGVSGANANWNMPISTGNAIAFLINVAKADDSDQIYPIQFENVVPAALSDDDFNAGLYWLDDDNDGLYSEAKNGVNTYDPSGTTTYVKKKSVVDMADVYAWAYVPVDTEWEPGKIYTYTLNFDEDAYGNIDPDQYDGGTKNPEPIDDKKPGDPVVEAYVPLTFTVTVSDWIDAAIDDVNL